MGGDPVGSLLLLFDVILMVPVAAVSVGMLHGSLAALSDPAPVLNDGDTLILFCQLTAPVPIGIGMTLSVPPL